MATISDATSTTTTTSATATTRASLASNFDTFLNLLTTQLKNQSPLDPLDTNQFTQQLVQFAGVEQQLKSNESLTALIAATKASSITSALGIVGATVTADGQTSQLKNGAASWKLQVPRSVSNAVVTITDSTGSTVFSEKRNFSAGEQAYNWSGRNSSGSIAGDGEYKVNVAALDAAGQTVTIRADLQGTVDKVDVSGTEAMISIGNISIPLSKVKTIQRN